MLTCELAGRADVFFPERREAGLSRLLSVFLADAAVMLDCRNVFKLKAGPCFESTLLVLDGWMHPAI